MDILLAVYTRSSSLGGVDACLSISLNRLKAPENFEENGLFAG